MPTIAIVQTAFIGDVVLATPLFESARLAHPGYTTAAVVRRGCEDILKNSPFVDEIVVWDKHGADKGIRGVFRIARRLRDLGTVTALIPHRSVRSALAVRLSGAKKRIGFRKGGGSLFHTLCVPYHTGIHEAERNLMLAGALAWPCENLRPAVFPDAHDRTVVDGIIGEAHEYVVFAPGSVWATKMWPSEYYIRVGEDFAQRGYTVFVSGGADDESLCTGIASCIPGAISVSGLLTLRQSAELYRRSLFLLTGDTAPQHLAAAVDARIFALFGPTIRDYGFWPYTDKGVIIEENTDCRPCGIHGHHVCPEGHHRCMRSLTPEKVIGIISKEVGWQ